jgi:IS5 family transposase
LGRINPGHIPARKDYLTAAKNKNISEKKLKQAIWKQLNYVKRDLKYTEKINPGGMTVRQHAEWITIKKLFEQQKEMFETGKHSVPGRIMSISQPHVRPIVRGRPGQKYPSAW